MISFQSRFFVVAVVVNSCWCSVCLRRPGIVWQNSITSWLYTMFACGNLNVCAASGCDLVNVKWSEQINRNQTTTNKNWSISCIGHELACDFDTPLFVCLISVCSHRSNFDFSSFHSHCMDPLMPPIREGMRSTRYTLDETEQQSNCFLGKL